MSILKLVFSKYGGFNNIHWLVREIHQGIYLTPINTIFQPFFYRFLSFTFNPPPPNLTNLKGSELTLKELGIWQKQEFCNPYIFAT